MQSENVWMTAEDHENKMWVSLRAKVDDCIARLNYLKRDFPNFTRKELFKAYDMTHNLSDALDGLEFTLSRIDAERTK